MTKTSRAPRRPRISATDAEVLTTTLGEHLSRNDAASLAHACLRTIDRWRRDGILTSRRLPSGEVLIDTASLLALLARGSGGAA